MNNGPQATAKALVESLATLDFDAPAEAPPATSADLLGFLSGWSWLRRKSIGGDFSPLDSDCPWTGIARSIAPPRRDWLQAGLLLGYLLLLLASCVDAPISHHGPIPFLADLAVLPFLIAAGVLAARALFSPTASGALRARFERHPRVLDLLETPARAEAIAALRSIALMRTQRHCASIGGIHAACWIAVCSVALVIRNYGDFGGPAKGVSQILAFCALGVAFGRGMALQHAAGVYAETTAILLRRDGAAFMPRGNVALLAMRLILFGYVLAHAGVIAPLVSFAFESYYGSWLFSNAEDHWKTAMERPDNYLPKPKE